MSNGLFGSFGRFCRALALAESTITTLETLDAADEVCIRAGVDPSSRGEQLAVAQFAALAEALAQVRDETPGDSPADSLDGGP